MRVFIVDKVNDAVIHSKCNLFQYAALKNAIQAHLFHMSIKISNCFFTLLNPVHIVLNSIESSHLVFILFLLCTLILHPVLCTVQYMAELLTLAHTSPPYCKK
jgi:hypothetical protein